MDLAVRTLRTTIIGLIALGAIIFVPAGTFAYWQGWTFIVVFSLSTTIIGLYLAIKDPALLARRVNVGPAAETRPLQKVLITLAMFGSIGLLIVSVLDHRFGWSYVPGWLSVVGDGFVALGLMIDLLVFRVNSYGASTVEKIEGQKVITTGPYALVRHPMYTGVLIMAFGGPLALGSLWGLVPMLLNVPILAVRMFDEEALLSQELDGYSEYMRKVRFRLMPGVW